MSLRVGLRVLSRSQQSAPLRAHILRPRQQIIRRCLQRPASSTSTSTAGTTTPQISILQRLWTSEVGVKTVHFWAPVLKWILVLAGVSDFFRPAESLSLPQNLALTATGSIWTRWCFIIKPKNYLLAAVNFCLAIVGVVQVSRILSYRAAVTGSAEGAVELSVEKEKEAGEGVKAEVKKEVEKAVR